MLTAADGASTKQRRITEPAGREGRPWPISLLRQLSLRRDRPLPFVPDDRFAAFISYRHLPHDRRWALWLHRALEAYAAPRALADRLDGRLRLGRVFRDEEELAASPNLSEVIRAALDRSEWLIVVCSSATPASRWVGAEIEHFLASGRVNRILPLLIDGEPAQSFPAALRAVRPDIAQGEAGMDTLPLAADVRRSGGLLSGWRRRLALMRLVAPLFGLRFDDLRVREDERRARRLLAVLLATITLVGILASLIFVLLQTNADLREQRAISLARLLTSDARLAAEAPSPANGFLDGALLAAARASAVHPLPESDVALLVALERAGSVEGYSHHHGGRAIWGVSFDVAGSRLVTVDQAGGVALVDARAGAPATTGMALSGERLMHVAIDPHGRRVALGATGGRLMLCRVDDGCASRFEVDGHTADVTRVAFSPDGRILASGDRAGRLLLTIFDGPGDAPGTQVAMPGHAAALHALNFDSASRRLASGDQLGRVLLWDLDDGRPPIMRDLGTLGIVVWHLHFNAPGSLLVSGDGGGGVTIWDLGQAAPHPTRHSLLRGTVLTLLIRDRVLFASDAERNFIRGDLGTLPSGVLRLEGHAGDVWSTAVSLDGRRLASVDETGELRLWDMNALAGGSRRLGRHDRHPAHFVPTLAFDPSGRRLASGGRGGEVIFWRLEGQSWLRHSVTLGGSLAEPGSSSPGLLAVVPQPGGVVQLRRSEDGSIERSIPVPPPGLSGLAISPGGMQLAIVDRTGVLTISSLRDNAAMPRTVRHGLGALHQLSLDDGGLRLVAAPGSRQSTDPRSRHLLMFDLKAPGDTVAVHELPGHGARPTATAMSANGALLVSGDEGGGLLLWDMNRNPPGFRMLEGHDRYITAIALAPGARSFATADVDGRVRLWNSHGDAFRFRELAQTSSVWRLAFAPDGNMLASSDLDGRVALWDAREGGILGEFTALHRRQLVALAFDRDGMKLTTVDMNGTLMLWDVDRASWRRRACRLAGRALRPAEMARYVGLDREPDPCASGPDSPGFAGQGG